MDVSSDERFIVTADSGLNSLLIVWDTKASAETVVPVKMIQDAHSGTGIIAAVFSCSGKYIFTLGNGILNSFLS
jgi:hypothetical protein